MTSKTQLPKWMKTDEFLVVVYPGKSPKSFKTSSEDAQRIIKALQDKDYGKVWSWVFPEEQMLKKTGNKIQMNKDGVMKSKKGTVIDPVIKVYLDKIPHTRRGYQALVNLSDNIQKCKNTWVRDQLARFLRANSMPITQDGCFLAYKYVSEGVEGLVDSRSNTIPNNVGDTPTLTEKEVDFNPHVTCSRGLHVAAWDYAKSMGGSVIILCKVNPKDVVSVPYDYDNQKMRCMQYTVVARDIRSPYDGSMAQWAWDVSTIKVSEPERPTEVKQKIPKAAAAKTKGKPSSLPVPLDLSSLSGSEIINLVDSSVSVALTVNSKSKQSVMRHATQALKSKGVRVNGNLAYVPVESIPAKHFRSHDMSNMSGAQIIAYVERLTGLHIPVCQKSKANVILHATRILKKLGVRFNF